MMDGAEQRCQREDFVGFDRDGALNSQLGNYEKQKNSVFLSFFVSKILISFTTKL